jgi:hypothetical protein
MPVPPILAALAIASVAPIVAASIRHDISYIISRAVRLQSSKIERTGRRR